MPEGKNELKRPGHIPLVWAVLPMIWGYSLGSMLSPSPIGLALFAILFLGVASGLSSPTRIFRRVIWGTFFLLGSTLLAWAWWLLREPPPPEPPLPPAREVTVMMEVDQLFGGGGHGPVSGLGTLIDGPQFLPHLVGQRCFFVLWAGDFQDSMMSGAIVQAKGKCFALDPETQNEGFHSFLFRSGVYYSLQAGQIMDLVQPAPKVEQWARAVNRAFCATLSIGAETPMTQSLAGISEGMLLGRKGGLQRSQKQHFIESGTLHLFAVSGLHVTVISGALAYLFSCLRLPRRMGAVLGVGMVLGYVIIVGHPPSAIRAFLMTVFFWGAVAFVRKPSSLSALLASAVLVLAWSPQELFRPGFQLSYAVVGGILLYGVPLANWSSERFRAYRYVPGASLNRSQRITATVWRWLLMTLSISLSATLFSAPLTIQYFSVFTPGAVVLNMALIPLASAVIVIAASSVIFGLIGLGSVSFWINHINWGLIWGLEKSVELATQVPGLFFPITWCSEHFATGTVWGLFLGFAISLHRPRFRPWFFLIPPGILLAFLAIGGKLLLGTHL